MVSKDKDSRRFTKQVPASAMAPSFKLSLPYEIVTKHLSHLVGRDFELAASNDATQRWTAQVLPRRNKDRSEFTLRGWRLFAEAHGVKVGDTLSFELVHSQRLVVQKVKDHHCVPDVQSPATRSRAQDVPVPMPATLATAPDVPATLGTAPDVKPFELMQAASEPKLEKIVEEADEVLVGSPAAQGWNSMDDWLVQASAAGSSLPPASSADARDLEDPAAARVLDYPPAAGMLMAVDEPAQPGSSLWPRLPELGRESGVSCQTLDRRRSSGQEQVRTERLAPGTPTAAGGSVPHLRGTFWNSPPPASALIPVHSHSLGHSNSGSWQGDAMTSPTSAATRILQNDVRRYELRAERAEREEVQLRLLLTSMREELGKCLHALGGLERNVHSMTHEDLQLRGDSLRHCQQIKTALWRVTSTDI